MLSIAMVIGYQYICDTVEAHCYVGVLGTADLSQLTTN